MNYVSNWYCLDLLSCLPYDIIYFILDGLKPQSSQNDSNASATSLFSALKGKGVKNVPRKYFFSHPFIAGSESCSKNGSFRGVLWSGFNDIGWRFWPFRPLASQGVKFQKVLLLKRVLIFTF